MRRAFDQSAHCRFRTRGLGGGRYATQKDERESEDAFHTLPPLYCSVHLLQWNQILR